MAIIMIIVGVIFAIFTFFCMLDNEGFRKLFFVIACIFCVGIVISGILLSNYYMNIKNDMISTRNKVDILEAYNKQLEDSTWIYINLKSNFNNERFLGVKPDDIFSVMTEEDLENRFLKVQYEEYQNNINQIQERSKIFENIGAVKFWIGTNNSARYE